MPCYVNYRSKILLCISGTMEQEIRKSIPITYLNIWDDYPAPMFNQTLL